MKRVLVLDEQGLTLSRSGRELKHWPLSDLIPGWQPGSLACDGAMLVISVGTLISTKLSPPDLAKADIDAYVERQWEALTNSTCGALLRIGRDFFVQEVHGATGLEFVLIGLALCGARLRRIRHFSQLSEVVYGCLSQKQSQCVVAWHCAESCHVAAVRDGHVLWHRTLSPPVNLESALAETIQFAHDRGLFIDASGSMTVFVGQLPKGATEIGTTISEAALARAMRRSDSSIAALMSLNATGHVLASARSDLRSASMRSRDRLRGVLRAGALVSMLICAPTLINLVLHRDLIAGHFRTDQIASKDPPPASLAQSSAYESLDLLSAIRSKIQTPGHPQVINWRKALIAVAEGMTAASGLDLGRVNWMADPVSGGVELLVVVTRENGTAKWHGIEPLVQALARAGWQFRDAGDGLAGPPVGLSQALQFWLRDHGSI